jgi:hypothetical protein
MSTITVTNIKATGQTASRDTSGVAAVWVSYTSDSSTSIKDSQNVSSLTDVDTGYTTVTFTNAMSSGNYALGAVAGLAGHRMRVDTLGGSSANPKAANFHFYVSDNGGTNRDATENTGIVTGDLA